MSGALFSLTDRYVSLTVENLSPADFVKVQGRFNNFKKFAKETLIARIVAIWTSAFCAIDALYHFVAGVHKVIKAKVLRNKDKGLSFLASRHFGLAGRFARGIIFGSALGFLNPTSIKLLELPRNFPTEIVFNKKIKEDISNFLSQHIKEKRLQLFRDVFCTGNGRVNVQALEKLWEEIKDTKTIKEREVFVQILNSHQREFGVLREHLATFVYRQPGPRAENRLVYWLNTGEVSQLLQPKRSIIVHFFSTVLSCFMVSKEVFADAPFFHETPTLGNLKSILSSRKIEVRHEQAFRGAWCSVPTPTGHFGRYKLRLRRCIERLSPLLKGFTVESRYGTQYWAGFSQPIPVTEETLLDVVVSNPHQGEIEELQKKCSAWAKRKIRVISFEQAKAEIRALNLLRNGIPNEWPEEDDPNAIITGLVNATKKTAAKIKTALARVAKFFKRKA